MANGEMRNLGSSRRKICQRVVKSGEAAKGRHTQPSESTFVLTSIHPKHDFAKGSSVKTKKDPAPEAASAWVGNLRRRSKKFDKKVIHHPAGCSRVSLTDSKANLEQSLSTKSNFSENLECEL